MQDSPVIAYFSMEIGLQPDIPTYAGGLGMLAGDTVRAAADMGVPLVAVSLLYRNGYFRQQLDASGWQAEASQTWQVEDHVEQLPGRCKVEIDGRTVVLRAWRYQVVGLGGQSVTVLLLDSDLPENSDWDRSITHNLYGGDEYYRLCQEMVLGVGGVRLLHRLGYESISRYHMNEGHAAMLVLELLEEQRVIAGHAHATIEDVDAVRRQCVFTTHTPVAAGHDRFPLDLLRRVLGKLALPEQLEAEFCHEGRLNMTFLALATSHYVNGVAKKHRETAQFMFARYRIDSITNGVHAATWVCPPFQQLFDQHIPGWKADNASLRYALTIPHDSIREAHRQAKARLLQHVQQTTGTVLAPGMMTIGFARRVTQYKRFDLLFQDIQHLRSIARNAGAFQLVFAGKAHPRDVPGKQLIQKIYALHEQLRGEIDIVFLENYDMVTAQMMTSGCDLWLNTPQPPLEASGTSGMKAAMNGVPSLSVLDGWWNEGCIEGITGWAIGDRHVVASLTASQEANALYDTLEQVVLPAFYSNDNFFVDIMRHAIALNGSFFNTERMLNQYVTKAYFS
ncbi:MAG: alpha-glucan family phosphorylase [Chromatiales bacterium]|jgi:starch phosphorylase